MKNKEEELPCIDGEYKIKTYPPLNGFYHVIYVNQKHFHRFFMNI